MIQILDNFLSETEINQIYKLLSSPEMSWFIVNDRGDSKIKNKSFGKQVGPEILRDDFYLNYLQFPLILLFFSSKLMDYIHQTNDKY